jgi:predicted nucleic acid-binding protein
LEDAGAPIGNLDLMLAAQMLATSATLVTHGRVFYRVKGLRVEDWTKPSP